MSLVPFLSFANAVFALWHDPSCWLIYAEADWGDYAGVAGQIDVGVSVVVRPPCCGSPGLVLGTFEFVDLAEDDGLPLVETAVLVGVRGSDLLVRFRCCFGGLGVAKIAILSV
ncbi:hypothetical protein Nepgr_006702 [Nepenthes gracilis]|uniref:Secreted protein n=1 Tax=Nepenthes gracilis TaxID=150966 RepID=A0AAD3S6C8_NEPGR|nr:hypothetical protein Nepgr_006702 [Nepenthes gracilis]